MRRRGSLPLALAIAMACQGAPPSRPAVETPTTTVTREPTSAALQFPPVPDRRARSVLPRELQAATPDASVGIVSPELDGARHFEFSGQTLRLRFNEKISVAKGASPALTITPAVAGTIDSPDDYTLRFVAAAPFDPTQTYALALGRVLDRRGHEVQAGWTASFRADPEIAIGGKIISYVPTPGEPMVVAISQAGVELDRRAKLTVLFDQPIAPALAGALLTMVADPGGEERELALRARVSRRRVFEGVAVPAGHIVEVETTRLLEPGTRIELRRAGPGAAADTTARGAQVADEMTALAPECWSTDACTYADGTLRLNTSNFQLRFSNTVHGDDKAARRAITITPSVRNLAVYNDTWSSDGRVSVSGEFAPSSRYHVEVAAVRDRFGQRAAAQSFDIVTPPLPASASMPEGARLLDASGVAKFDVVSRNVEQVTLKLWQIPDTAAEWSEAERRLAARELPGDEPTVARAVTIEPVRDQWSTVSVDLSADVSVGHRYLVALQTDTGAFGATASSYPGWSMAARPPMAMLMRTDDRALVVHSHRINDGTLLVAVAKRSDGTPVAGATFSYGDAGMAGTNAALAAIATDDLGIAALPAVPGDVERLLRVEHAGTFALVREGPSARASLGELSEFAGGAPSTGMRAMIVSDRGAYRPGSTVFAKGIARKPEGDALVPLANFPVRLTLTSPTGDDILVGRGFTDDAGGFAASWPSTRQAEIGRYTLSFAPMFGDAGPWTSEVIQVAEFEPPRFAVDVAASVADDRLKGSIDARYLFGAAMADASVSWTLTRSPAELPAGDLVRRGLRFVPDVPEQDTEASTWMRSGEGKLDDAGHLAVDAVVEMPRTPGPQRFELEASVTDESHRTIAARASAVRFDAERYVGVRVVKRSIGEGERLALELGVVDTEGNTVAGVPVTAVLERVDWELTRRPGPGGSMHEDWHEVRKEVGRCEATTKSVVVDCPITVASWGDYVVTARMGDQVGGSDSFWTWSRTRGDRTPRPGRRIELVADAASFAAGEIAKVGVANPFAEAIAIVTVEGNAPVRVFSRRVTEPQETFEIPITSADAPFATVTATLLPVASDPTTATQWKIGALRLPVAAAENRLELAVTTDRKAYAPGETAEIELSVARGGAPVEAADVALAIVDEGVLRLTDFHAPDPVTGLRPASGLTLDIRDSRDSLADLLASHVAGDGAAEGEQSLVATRKNFVQTALWEPSLRSDANGRVHVTLPLPDNLTRFRIMAVVLDREGRGGVLEDGFEVRKPIMVVPAVPRFAIVGDRFEAAAVVHNGTDAVAVVDVALAGQHRELRLPAQGRARAAFEIQADAVGERVLELVARDPDGTIRDRVESRIAISAPGIDERPRLGGAFVAAQDVILEVPGDAFVSPDHEDLTITMGQAMWPELGERLEFLVDYPHGCVEQTTSSTLPLLAARELLPRLGVTRWSTQDIDVRIAAGVERLATMQTGDGGLAYWPGNGDSNVYGTSYAMRALVRARAAGVTVPPRLFDGVKSYLVAQLDAAANVEPGALEIRTAIALALAEAEALPASSADALFDAKDKLGSFGKASLALALASLPGQDDRVGALLDAVEAGFDRDGYAIVRGPTDEFAYYGSDERTRAHAAYALGRLRPTSVLLPTLRDRLARDTGGYTTQATAFGLLALTDAVREAEQTPVELTATLDGEPLAVDPLATLELGAGTRVYRVGLERLRGRKLVLRMSSSGERAIGFALSARWQRPFASTHGLAATSAEHGPDLFRIYADATGKPVDLASVAPGQVVRVGLLARMPTDWISRDRIGYVAITDAIPAGFEPIQPELATVAQVPGLAEDHPLARLLAWGAADASFTEIHDDRVDLYFDRVWGEYVAATYLVRATTPGTFVVAPARVELMYEPDSLGYSDITQVTVHP